MSFRAEAVRFTGEALEFRSKTANGGDAVRNRCGKCMSLVFGGELGKTGSFTLYAGSPDDPSKLSIRPSPSSPKAIRPGRSSRRASRFSLARRPERGGDACCADFIGKAQECRQNGEERTFLLPISAPQLRCAGGRSSSGELLWIVEGAKSTQKEAA